MYSINFQDIKNESLRDELNQVIHVRIIMI
jgi:hypothetical protein